jgi:2-keto-4-pentenoate hydratase/2-oxohepta-3-ene-1,7-dioic acid hydratase in catechol pathway
MKFLRVGNLDREKPAALDSNNIIRDLSNVFKDLDPQTINFELLNKVKKIDLKTLPELSNNMRVGPCVNNPSKFIGIGLNFSDHAKEQNLSIPKEPIVFAKSPSSISGPFDNIEIPMNSKKLDWEVELAFVVGKKTKNIKESEAKEHIFGYCICDDVSEREFQKERGGQWIKGKSADTFGPIGPHLVTSDEIDDVQDLEMYLDVNDKRMQTGNTKKMIFSINFILSYLSNFMTLLPGDVITTGTPPGVGDGMKPPTYLKKGDVVKLGIETLGEQKHLVK